jgi:Ni,Fe-hydrogenase I cytochrome b subunit
MVQGNNSLASVTSPFIQEHSILIRVWHWLVFLFITAIIVTVLFVSTMLKPQQNAVLVQNLLKEKGVEITPPQASSVARMYENKMWHLHIILGYGIAILLLFRIFIEFSQPGSERILTRMKNVTLSYKKGGLSRNDFRHYMLVNWNYLIFYFMILIMVLTGLGLAFGHQIEFLGKVRRTMRIVHSAGQLLIYAFVLFHLVGVVLDENGKSRGIVSGMINGNG